MLLFAVLLLFSWIMVEQEEGNQQVHTLSAVLPLLLAILIRSGSAPFHCWMTHLFEHASLGTSLLFVTRNVGAYAAIRLVLPLH